MKNEQTYYSNPLQVINVYLLLKMPIKPSHKSEHSLQLENDSLQRTRPNRNTRQFSFSHVKCYDKKSIQYECGYRSRGRPKKRRMDCVKNDMGRIEYRDDVLCIGMEEENMLF